MDFRLKIFISLILFLIGFGFLAVSFLLLRGGFGDLFEAPEKPPSEELTLSADERALSVEASKLTISVPELWIVEKVTEAGFHLRPELSIAECSIRVAHGRNAGGQSASAFLAQYDLGPRFGSQATAQEQHRIQLKGWDAAFFGWNDAQNIRHRELYLPYGVYLLTIAYAENLGAIDRQPRPCIWEWDRLLQNGIAIP